MAFEKDKQETFEKGLDYKYAVIELFAHSNNFEIKEYGPDLMGQNMIVLEDEKETVITFIMTGYQLQGIYTCVYKN